MESAAVAERLPSDAVGALSERGGGAPSGAAARATKGGGAAAADADADASEEDGEAANEQLILAAEALHAQLRRAAFVWRAAARRFEANTRRMLRLHHTVPPPYAPAALLPAPTVVAAVLITARRCAGRSVSRAAAAHYKNVIFMVNNIVR